MFLPEQLTGTRPPTTPTTTSPTPTSSWMTTGGRSSAQQTRSCYQKVLELDPEDPQADMLREWLRANP